MVFGGFRTVSALLDANVDTDMEVPGGDAFMLACTYGRSENVESWLAYFPDWDVERTTAFGTRTEGNTALMSTAQNAPEPGASAVANVLLHARASVNAQNHMGTSVLGCA